MTLDFDLSTWIVGIAILLVLLTILKLRKHTLAYLLCFSIFWIYILVVLRETIFPIPLSGEMVEMMRDERTFMSGINLIPFYFGPFAFASMFTIRSVIITSVLNIILTLPFGFGINFVKHLRAKNFLWVALGVGIGIEILQLVISLLLGFPYRSIDINDVFFNAIGVLIGYGVFRGFAWLYTTMTQRLEIKHRGLSAWRYVKSCVKFRAGFQPLQVQKCYGVSHSG